MQPNKDQSFVEGSSLAKKQAIGKSPFKKPLPGAALGQHPPQAPQGLSKATESMAAFLFQVSANYFSGFCNQLIQVKSFTPFPIKKHDLFLTLSPYLL
jgi:hypothetical protein